MAGEWIKMRVGLTTNPRVMRIAECLLEDADFLAWSSLSYGIGTFPPPSPSTDRAERHAALRITRYVTVTALLRFWGYANEHAKDEFIAGIFPEDVEEITGVPGFAGALEASGWANFDPDGGMRLPNFEEHNTSASARSSGAARQKRYRERLKNHVPESTSKSDVTRDVTRDVQRREEKRREEKKKKQKPPSAAPTAELQMPDLPSWIDGDAWGGFIAMRKRERHPLTPRAAKLVVSELTKLRDEGHNPTAVLDQSTRNGWRDVYPVKQGAASVANGGRAAI